MNTYSTTYLKPLSPVDIEELSSDSDCEAPIIGKLKGRLPKQGRGKVKDREY